MVPVAAARSDIGSSKKAWRVECMAARVLRLDPEAARC
jgi:hypothetical protein